VGGGQLIRSKRVKKRLIFVEEKKLKKKKNMPSLH
jgi:hypothetical protein